MSQHDKCPDCGNAKKRAAKTCKQCRWGSLLSRFNARYCINTSSGCWEWTAARHTFGYGVISITKDECTTAHRAAWMLFRGVIPEGLAVLHRCDNPPCVNPEHLFLGTDADNVQDKVNKKRHQFGQSHYMAKITDTQARAIRSDPRTPTEIHRAREYPVGYNSIYLIKAGKTWTHLK